MSAPERPPLACSVRDCGLPLTRIAKPGGGTLTCARGHAFDVAQSGYVNLLQPQDRRSPDAGDSREAVSARRALLDAGFGAALLEALTAATAELGLPRGARTVDLGCGDGHFLATLCARFELEGFGVDLSAHAIERAARRHPALTWLVANADRRLPFVDAAFDLALSIDGRRQRDEIARVLRTTGALVIAVPASDDLVELRSAVLGEAHATDRAARVDAELAPLFERTAQRTARARVRLDRSGLEHLAVATYRCARTREREALHAIDALEVTTSHEVLTFRRRA
jgi:23S rRNA (guanine745-N1)-methyltransferase